VKDITIQPGQQVENFTYCDMQKVDLVCLKSFLHGRLEVWEEQRDVTIKSTFVCFQGGPQWAAMIKDCTEGGFF
jgi:hypothetical protein